MGRDGRGAFYDCAYDEGEFLSSPGNELWRCFDRGEISVQWARKLAASRQAKSNGQHKAKPKAAAAAE
jgi:hypothetical protein